MPLYPVIKGPSSIIIDFDLSIHLSVPEEAQYSNLYSCGCSVLWGAKMGEQTKAHWDKSPLDNIPLDKSPLLNLAGRTKAHFFDFSYIYIMVSLIRLLLQCTCISHTRSVFSLTLLLLVFVVTNNLIWVLKAINI